VLAVAPAPAPTPAPALAALASPSPREAHKDDHRDDPKKPSSLLVRASARSVDKTDDARDAKDARDPKLRLSDARSVAREHSTDAHALRAWAIAAMHAGENREARRAAESWAVHDNSAEPRLFLASALESSGRKREARAVLEEWLANHPDSAEAKRMLSRLGAAPEPAIKRGSRSRGSRMQLHPPDPVAADE
jgi:hypothetical protein